MILTPQLIKHLQQTSNSPLHDLIVEAICLRIGGQQYLNYYNSHHRLIADIYCFLEYCSEKLPFDRLHNGGEIKPSGFIISVVGHYVGSALAVYVVKVYNDDCYLITFRQREYDEWFMVWELVDINKPVNLWLKQDFMSEEVYNEIIRGILK